MCFLLLLFKLFLLEDEKFLLLKDFELYLLFIDLDVLEDFFLFI